MTILFFFLGALIMTLQLYYLMVMSGLKWEDFVKLFKEDDFVKIYYILILSVGVLFYTLIIAALYNHSIK